MVARRRNLRRRKLANLAIFPVHALLVVLLLVAGWSLFRCRLNGPGVWERFGRSTVEQYCKALPAAPTDTISSGSFSYSKLCYAEAQKQMCPDPTVPEAYQRYERAGRSMNVTGVRTRFIAPVQLENVSGFFNFLASARLAGVPVELLALPNNVTSAVEQQCLVMEYIHAAELRDEDVVVMLDPAVRLTGVDLYPKVEAFISRSPQHKEELNAWKVRQQRQWAPILFGASSTCSGLWGHDSGHCEVHANTMDQLYFNWGVYEGVHYNFNTNKERNRQVFLSNSFIIGRVWALRLLFQAYERFITSVPPLDGRAEWADPAQVYATLYSQLSYWEVMSGLLTSQCHPGLKDAYITDHLTPEERQQSRGPFGLVGGLFALDYENHFLLAISKKDIRHAHTFYGGKPLRVGVGTREAVEAQLRAGTLAHLPSSGSSAAMAKSSLSYVAPSCLPLTSPKKFGIPCSHAVEGPIWYPHSMSAEDADRRLLEDLIPSRVILDAFHNERDASRLVFWSAPPHKVWRVNTSCMALSPVVSGNYVSCLQRDPSGDLHGESLCSRSSPS